MKETILNITVTVNIRIPLPPTTDAAAMQPEERPDRPREVRHEHDKTA